MFSNYDFCIIERGRFMKLILVVHDIEYYFLKKTNLKGMKTRKKRSKNILNADLRAISERNLNCCTLITVTKPESTFSGS